MRIIKELNFWPSESIESNPNVSIHNNHNGNVLYELSIRNST